MTFKPGDLAMVRHPWFPDEPELARFGQRHGRDYWDFFGPEDLGQYAEDVEIVSRVVTVTACQDHPDRPEAYLGALGCEECA